jgi:hypothetical protein
MHNMRSFEPLREFPFFVLGKGLSSPFQIVLDDDQQKKYPGKSDADALHDGRSGTRGETR